MSTPTTQPSAAPSGTQQPLRLSSGVIALLVLTLFASCSAANSAQDAASAARNADSRTVDVSPGQDQEVQAMCRLLGAMAAKQGVDVAAVFKDNPSGTLCEQIAAEAQTARR